MIDQLPSYLANFKRKGYVIAPAGYGKTHLIALAVKAASEKQLILTHTYAGVHSIRNKMQALSVPSSHYQIDTIASWSLRMCTSYPATADWHIEFPNGKQWQALYSACTSLLDKPFFKQIVCSSYAGVYVDEYQDCSISQHALVDSIANLLPCRLLGDPMQAIFDFSDQPVNWDQHIFPHYQKLGELTIPWRWNLAGAGDLGNWLDNASRQLRANGKISLRGPLPKGVTRISIDLDDYRNTSRLNFFYKFLDHEDTVIAIHSGDQKSKNKTHNLAKLLSGKFSSIEEVEGKDLLGFLKKYDACEVPSHKLLLTIEFAKKCFNSVANVLPAATKRGEKSKLTRATKYPDILLAANQYLATPTAQCMLDFVAIVQQNAEISTYRRDLLNRLIKVLRLNIDNTGLTLSDSAKEFQRSFRHSGRPIRHNKLIGTTLLVKGLEYQHAIILEADTMQPKELYVALTRGAKTITIVTLKDFIPE